MAKTYRFKKRDSDRSGFTHKEVELLNDKGSLVSVDEYDTPPPSDKSLGGEGEVSPGVIRTNSTSYDTPTDSQMKTVYLGASSTIPGTPSMADLNNIAMQNYIYICGSASDVVLVSNPQVGRGAYNQQTLILQCVGSSVTLINGNGLDLKKGFLMTSGSILNLIYSQTDNLWHETSRGQEFNSIGEF